MVEDGVKIRINRRMRVHVSGCATLCLCAWSVRACFGIRYPRKRLYEDDFLDENYRKKCSPSTEQWRKSKIFQNMLLRSLHVEKRGKWWSFGLCYIAFTAV
jgi:hypothetical protein